MLKVNFHTFLSFAYTEKSTKKTFSNVRPQQQARDANGI